VLLAVEILSPSSLRTDRVIKFAEYADAGIPHYWMIDLDPPISLRAFHLAEPFGYRESEETTGTYAAREPFPVTLDLDALDLKR
jgi:Uma2 family endonuclease